MDLIDYQWSDLTANQRAGLPVGTTLRGAGGKLVKIGDSRWKYLDKPRVEVREAAIMPERVVSFIPTGLSPVHGLRK